MTSSPLLSSSERPVIGNLPLIVFHQQRCLRGSDSRLQDSQGRTLKRTSPTCSIFRLFYISKFAQCHSYRERIVSHTVTLSFMIVSVVAIGREFYHRHQGG